MKNRRSIYNIDKNVSLSQDEISELVKEAVKESPSSFNSQTARAVVLFGASHNRLWDITEAALRKEVPTEEAFQSTKAKLDTFRAGYGTVLILRRPRRGQRSCKNNLPYTQKTFRSGQNKAQGLPR